MSSETTNLHLVKPADNEAADIDVINDNMDIIDAAVSHVPIGYDWPSRVNLLSYTESNPYTATVDGVAFVASSWRQSAYSIAYIKTGSDAALTIELASPSSGNAAGTQSTMAPVFAGQKLWGARNPDVAYGEVLFIPYKY